MARTKRTISRAEQRAIVLKSEPYLQGDEFDRSVIAPLIGLTNEGTANMLTAMANDGLLVKRMKKQGAKTFIAYSKPASRFARMKIRKLTDEQIGIESCAV